MKTTAMNARGKARLSSRTTAPTSVPIATEKAAGMSPRSTRTSHQAYASARSAFGSTDANWSSGRARKRSIMDPAGPEGRSSVCIHSSFARRGRPRLYKNAEAGVRGSAARAELAGHLETRDVAVLVEAPAEVCAAEPGAPLAV